MTNKPFDPTRPYCRRDGKPAEIVYSGIDRHVVRSVNIMGKEILYLINHEGIITANLDHNLDLINIPEKKDWYPANFDEAAKMEVEKDLREANK